MATEESKCARYETWAAEDYAGIADQPSQDEADWKGTDIEKGMKRRRDDEADSGSDACHA